MPGVSWCDLAQLFYGSTSPRLFPAQRLKWGGMSADTSIFLQEAFSEVSKEWFSTPDFRIFSKLGAGFSESRLVGEITNLAQ